MSMTPKLEGWLIKKRGDYHKNKFLGKDNMRWFKLQEVTGTDHDELALCYFKSQKEKEPKGWIFAKDIIEIRDTNNTFTVISPGRTMTIECQTPHEQFLWLKNLLEYCHNADVSRVFSISTEFLKERKSINVHRNEYKEESKNSFDRSSALFSRNADVANESAHFTDAIKGSGNSVNIDNEENENIPNSNQQNTYSDEDYRRSLVSIDANETINNSKPNKKNSIGRTSTNQREDLRNSRNSSNLGVTTSNRLSKHISRDTSPSMIIRTNTSNRTTNNQELDQQAKSDFIPSKYIHEDHLNNSTPIAPISVAIAIPDSSSSSGKDVEDITLETDEVMKHRAKLRDRRNRNNHRTQRRMDGRSHYYSNDDDHSSNSDSSNSSRSETTSLSRHRDRDTKHESDSISRTTIASATTSTHVPRRVKDILDDESQSAASSSVNNKHRVSIDDLLLKRENFTTSTIADSKLDDSRSDEEVDFKAEMKKYNVEPTLQQQQQQQQDSKETNPSIVRTCNCNNIYRTCECTTNTSRPPRCPPSGAPPYNLSLANNSNINNNNHNSNNMTGSNIGKENALSKFRVAGTTRSYTPPRKSADPGSKVDENFVNDNWDEDDITNADNHHRHTHSISNIVGDTFKAQNKDTTINDKITYHNNNHNGHNSIGVKKQPLTSATTIMSSNSIRNAITHGVKTIEADRNWLQEDFDEN